MKRTNAAGGLLVMMRPHVGAIAVGVDSTADCDGTGNLAGIGADNDITCWGSIFWREDRDECDEEDNLDALLAAAAAAVTSGTCWANDDAIRLGYLWWRELSKGSDG